MRKLFLILLLVTSASVVLAYDFKVGDLCYKILTYQTNAVKVTYEVYNTQSNYVGLTNANIPDTVTYQGTTYRVTSIGEGAFYYCSGLTSITIPNSVTTIGYSAFHNCFSLSSVTIPNSVTSIGESAFYGCSSLTSVNIPNSLTSIEYRAFFNCRSLTSVTIPNSVVQIGVNAFTRCSSLTSVIIPNSVTSIGDEAFRDCSSLTSVSIGNSVTSIGNSAFSACHRLISVTIPNNVTSIGERAFANCSGLLSVTFPNNVTSIKYHTFFGCTSLTSFTIPTSVTTIEESSFSNCSSLPSITIPNSVTNIGKHAFYTCSGLTFVTIGNSVTNIDEGAFANCSNLVSMVVDAGNTMYDSRDNCNAIIETATNILIAGCPSTTIPNSVTCIGEYAFYYCSALTSITIPSSVMSMESKAFFGCNGLTSITCEAATPPALGTKVFQSVSTSIPLYVLHNSIALYQAADQWKNFMNIQAISEKIIIDSAICESDLPLIWQDKTIPYAGTYYDTLQAVEGYDSVIQILKLTVYPTYLIEEMVTINENELPYMWQGMILFQSGDFRKEYTSSTGCDSVHTLHLIVTEQPIYTVNVLAEHGQVNGTGTYPEGMQITLTVEPDDGFEFLMWSDGTTTNPKSITVMQDTTFRALFYMPGGKQEVMIDSVGANSVTIIWDAVPGATLYELRIYNNVEPVVTYQIDANSNIINETFNSPNRLIARSADNDGSLETLGVEVSGLDPNQYYTYSLDALDDERNFVGAQSGAFTTAEEETELESVRTIDEASMPRKILRDGCLYIELPDGTQYSPLGQEVN